LAIEIERKFLLRDDSWKQQASRQLHIRQGYLIGAKQASVRVRIENQSANLNIKGMTLGVQRQEFEYPIPLADANELLTTLCDLPLIEKIRYLVPFDGSHWEIDEFTGDNTGLVVAEIELEHEDAPFTHPPWLGIEVSDDPRYYNTCLAKHPYKEWKA